MPVIFEATVERGELKFPQPLALPDGTAVRVTITPIADEITDPLDAVIGICDGGPVDGAARHDRYLYEQSERSFSIEIDCTGEGRGMIGS